MRLTSRWSTSRCRRTMATTVCSPPRRSARMRPRSGSWCCRSSSRTGTRSTCSAIEPEGVGYLLKDRMADVDGFTDAVRRVARGGSVIDPEVVGRLVGRRRGHDPVDELSPSGAGGSGPDGRGQVQPRDRRDAGRHRLGGGASCDEHLRQAADTSARSARAPARARGAALPAPLIRATMRWRRNALRPRRRLRGARLLRLPIAPAHDELVRVGVDRDRRVRRGSRRRSAPARSASRPRAG